MNKKCSNASLTAVKWFFLSASLGCLLVSNANAQPTVETLLQSSVSQVGPEHREVADAIEQFKQGKFVECRNLLIAARKKDPKIPPAGVMLAQLLYAAGQPVLARAELEGVAKDESSDPEAYLLFGEVAFRQQRFSDAELAFRRAAELINAFSANPRRKSNMVKRAYSGLAGVAEKREDWVGAVKFLNPIVKAANNTDVDNTIRMAQAIFKQDKKIGDGDGEETLAYQELINLWKADPTKVRRPEIIMGSMYQ